MTRTPAVGIATVPATVSSSPSTPSTTMRVAPEVCGDANSYFHTPALPRVTRGATVVTNVPAGGVYFTVIGSDVPTPVTAKAIAGPVVNDAPMVCEAKAGINNDRRGT